MTHQPFRFYDFEKHWDEFYKVWISDEVQDVLECDMQEWCQEEAYYEHTESGLQKPVWKRCDDLWRYSKTDHHSQRNLDKCNAYVESEGCVDKYEQAMSRFGIRFSDKACACEAFWNVAGDHLTEMFEPKPGSLEANVLFCGANYLAVAMKVAAKQLFPDSLISIISTDEGRLVIVDGNLIFDFVRFYLRDDSTVADLVEQFDLVYQFFADDSASDWSDVSTEIDSL